MDGEHEFAATLVERFTTYHRCSYICKSGVGDVLIGAAAKIAEMNGVDPQAYLADILDRSHDHKINRLDELLPWNRALRVSVTGGQAA